MSFKANYHIVYTYFYAEYIPFSCSSSYNCNHYKWCQL